MKIHEYQARELLASYGLPVDGAFVCYNVEEAVEAYRKLNAPLIVVKAQVHTGGRGKAGGVKLAKNETELKQHAGNILGMDIKGFVVDRVLVGRAVDIKSEYYVSYVIDRKSKSTILMLSREGGMDIEEVAQKTPEKIHKIIIDPLIGVPDYLAREAAFKLFDDIKLVREAATVLQKLYKAFIETDASLAEINPLVLTPDNEIKAIDAKMTL